MDTTPLDDSTTVEIPFDLLPEGRSWKVGQAYRVKVVLRMTGTDEDGAEFEIVDANSLEPGDAQKKNYLTEGGYLKK